MKDKIIRTRTITPSCAFDCEMVVGPDVTLINQEVRKIYDESIRIPHYEHDYGSYSFVSISDFKNADGQTIGEFLLDKHEAFAVALSKKE